MCLTYGQPGRLCLMVSFTAEVPGSLGIKGSTTDYTIHGSGIQLVIKPELLLGSGSSGVIAPGCGQLGQCSGICARVGVRV